MNEIMVKYHNPDLTRITAYDKGDWIDLRSAEEVHMKAGEFRLISLGVSIKIPEMFEMWLAPRSSTFKKYGIIQTNSIGIIDNSYCGNNDIIKMPVYAVRDTVIPFNERISQFRFIPRMKYTVKAFRFCIKFKEVYDLVTEDRGGFGSSVKSF